MVSSLLHPNDLDRSIVPNPPIVTPNTPILNVLALMNCSRQTCPLVSSEKTLKNNLQSEERSSCVLIVWESHLVGIITERDLVKRAAAGWEIGTAKAADIMTSEPIVLARSQFHDPFSVLSLFRQYRIRHLPIVSEKGTIMGVVTPATLRQILQPADLLRMRSVSEVMKSDVVWVHLHTSILKLAQLMVKHCLSCILIARETTDSRKDLEPLGIVTEGDIVQFQALGLDLKRIPAAEVMSSPVFSLPPKTSLWQAHCQMKAYFVQRLAVTGERGELLGVINQMGILQAIEPWEMYETIDSLRDRVCQLETEKHKILKQQNSELEQQVRDRTKQVRELNQQLEQQVRDRTAQLEAANQQLQRENQERQLLTQQLQQSEATLRGLFNAMNDVVLIVDRDIQYIQIIPTNPIFSQSGETDFIEKTIEQFWEHKSQFLDIVKKTLATQINTKFEYSLSCDRENQLSWFTAKVVPLSQEKVLWVARETSDRKQAEVLLKERVQERNNTLKALTRERNLVTKILNVAGALIVVCSRDGRILRFNQTCEQTTGYQFDEIFGHCVWDFFIIPEEIEEVQFIFQQLRDGNIPDRSENYWLTKDGNLRLISWSNTVLLNEKGEVEYIIGTGIDLTELKEAKRALRFSEEKFHYLAENIRDVFFIRDTKTDKILYISPAFEEIWQISCDRIYQNSQLWFEAIYPEDRERLNVSIEQKRNNISNCEEFRIIRPDEQIRWICEQSFSVFNEQGKIETIVGIAEDITDRKNAEFLSQQVEQALKEMNQELEKRVDKRTAELQQINEQLKQEILQRQTIEEALWESEEELRDLFDNANDLIQSVSLEDGRILYVNRAWRETLGYEEHELANLSLFDVMTSECWSYFQKDVKKLKTGQLKQLDRIELTFLTKTGYSVTLEGNINARCLESGIPIATRGIFRDITERKKAEEKLQQQLSAIEAAVDGIGILKNNTYTYLNQAHAQIFGYNCAEELVGKTWQELYSFAEYQRFEQDIFPLLEQQRFWQGEAIAKRKNGNNFPEEISLTLTEDGTLICVCRDITKRKKNEAKILEALIKEQELNDLKSRFISMTSHEFRTPLAVIASSAGILKSFSHKLSEPKKQEHLQTIQTYVKHTTQLLDDILTINHAESGKMSFNPEPIALLKFCQTLIQEIQVSSDLHNILLNYDPENIPAISEVMVSLDKKLLRQILINLLSNALKYSPDGGEVSLAIAIRDRQVEFQVRDSGIGIPESEQDQLFDSFNRASNVGTIQGTGLGLSIVKKCVDLYDGQIKLNSEVGQGTTFIVHLPYC